MSGEYGPIFELYQINFKQSEAGGIVSLEGFFGIGIELPVYRTERMGNIAVGVIVRLQASFEEELLGRYTQVTIIHISSDL